MIVCSQCVYSKDTQCRLLERCARCQERKELRDALTKMVDAFDACVEGRHDYPEIEFAGWRQEAVDLLKKLRKYE